jgi:hypothetical protein
MITLQFPSRAGAESFLQSQGFRLIPDSCDWTNAVGDDARVFPIYGRFAIDDAGAANQVGRPGRAGQCDEHQGGDGGMRCHRTIRCFFAALRLVSGLALKATLLGWENYQRGRSMKSAWRCEFSLGASFWELYVFGPIMATILGGLIIFGFRQIGVLGLGWAIGGGGWLLRQVFSAGAVWNSARRKSRSAGPALCL